VIVENEESYELKTLHAIKGKKAERENRLEAGKPLKRLHDKERRLTLPPH